jgi:hypothetical protein
MNVATTKSCSHTKVAFGFSCLSPASLGICLIDRLELPMDLSPAT